MAHTSTTITAPVYNTDIMAVLGETSTLVSVLCRSVKINHWGGGPFNHSTMSFYSEGDTIAHVRAKRAAARKEANQGWAITTYMNPLQAVNASKAGNSSWSRMPITIARSDDFDEYNHAAGNPFQMYISNDTKKEVMFGGLEAVYALPNDYTEFSFLANQGQYDTAYVGFLMYKSNMGSGSVTLTAAYRGATEVSKDFSMSHSTMRDRVGSGDFMCVPVIFLSNRTNLILPYTINGETNEGYIYLLPSTPIKVHVKSVAESNMYPSDDGIYVEYNNGSGYVNWFFNGYNGYRCEFAFEVTVHNGTGVARNINVDFGINNLNINTSVPAYGSITRRFSGTYDSIPAPKDEEELSVSYTVSITGYTTESRVFTVYNDGGSFNK
ncbi:MAG: hypothetical protein HDR74_06880 [Bacteroides sp.]|nr:hypothetical protein [Bacteroides sp.]